MEFRVEELAPCRKKVTVTVPAEDVRAEFDSQYREVNKQVILPGFRPGKAPRRLLESRFGDKIAEDVKQKIVETAYEKLVEDKKIAPLRRPTVDLEKSAVAVDQPFEFGFEVVTRPDFTLPTWKDREVKVPPVDVSDEEVDRTLEQLLVSEGTLVPADEAGAEDVVVLSYEALEGDEKRYAAEDAYYRLGRGVLDGIVSEGLDRALLGAKAGTKARVEARTAADDPRTEIAGKSLTLALEVREVKRFQPAAVDADFLKRHDYDDEAEMRKDLRRRVLRRKERARDRLAEDRLVDSLVEEAKVPIPTEVVDSAVEGWQARRRVEAQAEGVEEEAIAKELAGSAEDVRKNVEQDLRRHFVLDRIADEEKLDVSEGELLGAVEQIARDAGRAAGEVAAEFQQDPSRLAELRTYLRHQKARESLRKAARLVEEHPTPEPKAGTPSKKEAAPKARKGK